MTPLRPQRHLSADKAQSPEDVDFLLLSFLRHMLNLALSEWSIRFLACFVGLLKYFTAKRIKLCS